MVKGMAGLKVLVPFMVVMFLIFSLGEASREILVGGKPNGWTIPSSANDTLNIWAEKTRFRVGDILVFPYDSKSDSVLEVTKESYDSCNKTNPIKEYKDGKNTKIKLEHSGGYFFISGPNCEKGEKLIVVVLSENHWIQPNISSKPEPVPASSASPFDKVFSSFIGLLGIIFFLFI